VTFDVCRLTCDGGCVTCDVFYSSNVSHPPPPLLQVIIDVRNMYPPPLPPLFNPSPQQRHFKTLTLKTLTLKTLNLKTLTLNPRPKPETPNLAP